MTGSAPPCSDSLAEAPSEELIERSLFSARTPTADLFFLRPPLLSLKGPRPSLLDENFSIAKPSTRSVFATTFVRDGPLSLSHPFCRPLLSKIGPPLGRYSQGNLPLYFKDPRGRARPYLVEDVSPDQLVFFLRPRDGPISLD